MTCEKLKDIISQDEAGRNQEACLLHIKECDKCRALYGKLYGLMANMKTTKEKIPSGFTDRVMAKVTGLKAPVNYNYWKAATAALALLVIVTGGLLVIEKNKSGEVAVEFSLAMPEAESVSIAGDFNGWDASNAKLIKKNGVWTATIKVKPGRYQYAFVVNEGKWLPDPNALKFVDSGFGGKNSIIEVDKL